MSKGEGGLTREFLAERDLRIFKLRQAGVTHGEIARRFGMSSRAVGTAIRRQLEKLNSEALVAYPELLRMELERLDSLQSAIWPMTQHRKIEMDDGTEVTAEPDLKAIQQVLSIMDRRQKLLGMEQTNLNIQMDVNSQVNVRSTLSGVIDISTTSQFSPESEARKLLEIMGRSGVLPPDVINSILDEPSIDDGEVIDVEEAVSDGGDVQKAISDGVKE